MKNHDENYRNDKYNNENHISNRTRRTRPGERPIEKGERPGKRPYTRSAAQSRKRCGMYHKEIFISEDTVRFFNDISECENGLGVEKQISFNVTFDDEENTFMHISITAFNDTQDIVTDYSLMRRGEHIMKHMVVEGTIPERIRLTDGSGGMYTVTFTTPAGDFKDIRSDYVSFMKRLKIKHARKIVDDRNGELDYEDKRPPRPGSGRPMYKDEDIDMNPLTGEPCIVKPGPRDRRRDDLRPKRR